MRIKWQRSCSSTGQFLSNFLHYDKLPMLTSIQTVTNRLCMLTLFYVDRSELDISFGERERSPQ